MARPADLAAISFPEKCIYDWERKAQTEKDISRNYPCRCRSDWSFQRGNRQPCAQQFAIRKNIGFCGWHHLQFAVAEIFCKGNVLIKWRPCFRTADFRAERIDPERFLDVGSSTAFRISTIIPF